MAIIPSPRIDELVARLTRGMQKTNAYFGMLKPEQWQAVIYEEPPWQTAQILAHLASSEQQLLALAQNVVSGGTGAPEGFAIDRFNAEEQDRLHNQTPQELLETFEQVRQKTIAWIETLDEAMLDKLGNHPALGKISVEAMIMAIFGHQLLHLRDTTKRLQSTDS